MPYYRCAACGLTSYSAAAHASVRVCPNCSASLSAAPPLDLDPAEVRTTGCVLSARPEAASEARRVVVGLPLPRDTLDRVRLLVSELVSNSVLHAQLAPDDPVRLEITVRPDRVRVEVRDGGAGFDPSATGRCAQLTAGGKGLVIVDALSDEWGADCDAEGCTVWCETAIEAEAAQSGGASMAAL